MVYLFSAYIGLVCTALIGEYDVLFTVDIRIKICGKRNNCRKRRMSVKITVCVALDKCLIYSSAGTDYTVIVKACGFSTGNGGSAFIYYVAHRIIVILP